MSSLAAARADNFYYAPGFDPEKHKTLNKFNGQHPLRERAAKLDQGILVIRFEMPFNIWCGKCNEMVAKGERFNADKKAIGMYHSTKILQFSMRHHCGCTIVIQTDPKNTAYLVVDGGRKKEEDYDAAEAGVLQMPDEAERALLDDPFYRLEHGEGAKVKAKTEAERVADIWDEADERHRDNYSLNKKLRAQLRGAKKEDAKLDERRKELNLPDHIRLLPDDDGDAAAAALAFFAAGDVAKSQRSAEAARRVITSESIFGSRHLVVAGGGGSTRRHTGPAHGSSAAAPPSGVGGGASAAAGSAGRAASGGGTASGSGRIAGAAAGAAAAAAAAAHQPGRSVSAPHRSRPAAAAASTPAPAARAHGGGAWGAPQRTPGSAPSVGGGSGGGAKRSLTDKALLLAKRQRLQDAGVRLGLGGTR